MSDRILDHYTDKPPSLSNTIGIFKGEWSSAIPGCPDGGRAPLFSDPRADYWIKKTNELFGSSLTSESINALELGPLEGAHSYMFSNAGWNVTSIESNSRAFLKTLIIYNEFNLHAKALYGDFIPYLKNPSTPLFNFIAASGVLYHMKNPLETIDLILSKCLSVGIWTHFYDESLTSLWPNRWSQIELSAGGTTYPAFKQFYGQGQKDQSFCGGGQEYSIWVQKDDILTRLSDHGFDIDIHSCQMDHPNGPCMTLFAHSKHKPPQ
ncbi:class I SAM-dependent methyltransferase [Cyanobium sp. NS01]|jgi:hypothetical protein|uniref:class I SAM-dependent methyltransferase n=1 Tax=Cyanobium sp. NS01 TaxID=261284 RepID=UPI001648FA9F|nr:class I SAM-dependent methyltransferase [Cyanobium sp. NS01]QNI69322.1 methyltransferase domain protein [Cyanobium sp. NS01]